MRELFCGFTPAFFGSKAIKFVPGSRYRKRREGSEQDKSAAKQCNFILMMELRKKITTFRDIIDLPLCSTTLSTDKMILGTMHDLHKYYPESIPRFRNSKLKRLPLDKLLIHFCKALQELVDVSDMTGEGEDKCKLDLNDNEETKTVEQIVEITVATLNGLIKIARDKCDMNDEDEDEENDKGLCQKVKPCKENGYYCPSPTSVLTEFTNNPLKPPYPSPLMLSVNVQAVGKLSPIDVKRLQLHMLPAYRDEDPSFLKQSNVIIEEQENGDVVDETGDPNSQKDQVSDSNAASGDTTINESEVAPITPLLALPPDVTPHPELPGDEDGSASPPSETQTQVLSQIPPPPPQSNGEVTKPTSEATEPEPPSSITALEEKTATGVPSPPPPPLAPSKPNIRLTTAATPPPPAPLKSNIGVTAVAASPTPTPPAPTEPNIEIRVVAAPAESNIEVTTTTTVLPTAAPKEPNIEVTAEVAPSAAPASTPGEPNIEVTTSLPPPPPTEPNIDVTVVLPPPPTSAPTELNIEVTTSPPTEQNVGVITALPPPTAPTVEKEAPLTPSPSPPQAAPTGTASGQLPPPPPPPPMMTSKASGPVPPPPPMMTSKELGPVPPPPPMMTSKASGPVPPPPPGMSRANGAAPPPPAFGGLSLRKATTKLKRSSHMGNLYRSLKGKVEGFPKQSSSTSNGRKGGGGAASGGNGKQGMADALEEMTKRSTYFIQIEEDAKKYEKSIKELKTSIGKFKTSDMSELIKFHKYVESILENLTDESQVLAKFEGFPSKKLEALRTAAALYLKLESMLNELHNMKIEPPLTQLTEKVERYFDKIKKEIDSLERTKDEEAKKLKGHNIEFNFQIILRIKEAMVDVSSNYMELVLKERRESKLAANEGFKRKGEAPKKVCTKVIWRTFQFAFRVYTFAGGHDDRADRLTRELAHEIECDPEYSQL